MKDPIRPCVQEKCPNKKQRTQGLIYRTIFDRALKYLTCQFIKSLPAVKHSFRVIHRIFQGCLYRGDNSILHLLPVNEKVFSNKSQQTIFRIVPFIQHGGESRDTTTTTMTNIWKNPPTSGKKIFNNSVNTWPIGIWFEAEKAEGLRGFAWCVRFFKQHLIKKLLTSKQLSRVKNCLLVNNFLIRCC